MFLIFLLCVILCSNEITCSRILALMTVPSHSHHLWNSVYLEALAGRGHEITYVTLDDYPNRPNNIRLVFIENGYLGYDSVDYNVISALGPFANVDLVIDWDNELARNITKQPGFAKFINIAKTEKFDLVVLDVGVNPFWLGAVDLVGKPPVIGITAYGTPVWAHELTGTPYPIQYVTKETETFSGRIGSAAIFAYQHFQEIRLKAVQTKIARKAFGEQIRSLEEISEDMNIVLVNRNKAIDYPAPLSPGLIGIGGLHIKPVKVLPLDIQRFLAAATEGAIFFSLGSNIKGKDLEKKTVNMFVEAFGRIAPVRVLWKFDETLENLPLNVKISKWLPQNDILNHAHVRLFITHGGLLSSQEAVYHGKPMIGIPFFLDQHPNVEKFVELGVGESLNINNLDSDTIVKTIWKLLGDKKYSERAANLSKIFRDDESQPLERAVFWTEYAIRHHGAHHLQPASKRLSWYQNTYLDIYLALSAILVISFVIFHKTVKIFLSRGQKIKQQ